MVCPIISQFCLRKRIALVAPALPMPVTDAVLLAAVFAPQIVALTFDRPVTLIGFPSSWVIVGGAADGESPIGAVKIGEAQIDLQFVGDTTLAVLLRMPSYDSAIRTVDGGFAVVGGFLQ